MSIDAKVLGALIGLWGVLGAAVPALAGPLQRGDVAGAPAWVLHLDCDRLRRTAIGQYLLAEMEKPEAQAKLAAFRGMLGIDLRQQLHGLTLYGTGSKAGEGVFLVYADFEADRLVALATAAKDYQSTTNRGHVIHSWADVNRRGKNGDLPRVYAGIHEARVVVFGQREAVVGEALEVLRRATASLASSGVFAELGAVGNLGFMQGAARRLDLPEGDPSTALLRLAKGARLEARELGGQVQATLRLEAEDEGGARQMALVGQGLLALMKLRAEEPFSLRLAEALALKQEGAGLVATLAIPTNEAIALIRADAEAKANKRAGR